MPSTAVAFKINWKEKGTAKKGDDPHEVVVAVGPAFGAAINKTIVQVDHASVLREVLAGIEEQGVKARVIRSLSTADLAFMAHQAAKLSGSGYRRFGDGCDKRNGHYRIIYDRSQSRYTRRHRIRNRDDRATR
ncbi:glycerol dehydratase reactivase beta/small subunit family protein [Aneurinibacillus thermoaerophilus]|uniref:glycerol dehydratase reactivase beta/small subunit family protein n=1 Tax=Aneurinibacillus thermoaerophilus TaxID=143495 RepID=UPI000B86D2BE|nr:glycerol dehydratase reactivase beta/small subunit family protein [Aneurinibacillus thermoaerophilus]